MRIFPKCSAQNAFFIGIEESSTALVDISWLKAKPVKFLVNGDWMLSQSYYVIKKRPHGAQHGKTDAQKKYFVAHNARIVSNEIQCIVNRNLTGWTEEKSIEMDKLAQENRSHCPSYEEYERSEKLV